MVYTLIAQNRYGVDIYWAGHIHFCKLRALFPANKLLRQERTVLRTLTGLRSFDASWLQTKPLTDRYTTVRSSVIQLWMAV